MDYKPKILVVDDTPRNLRLMEGYLTAFGYQVLLAQSGLDALAQVETDPPDLILLDALMPGMDGFSVLQHLKSGTRTNLIPVIMVTSLSEREVRIRALEAGADDFLSRPVDATELQARVRSLLRLKAQYDRMQAYQELLEVEVARQTAELQSAYEKIKVASLDTIHRLARAAEYKDQETGAHLVRMSHYAAVVARQMGRNESEVELLLYAAPLHDVGKISVPDHILLKPGKLDPDEWEIMKQHPVVGGDILAGSDAELIQLAQKIALTHHEKWDGSGYPYGLRGTEIPLVGRITAIADVFDALTSNRPYRAAMSVEEALQIIREGRGTHFDPEVVDAFLAAEAEIQSIMRRYEDEVGRRVLEEAGESPLASRLSAIWPVRLRRGLEST